MAHCVMSVLCKHDLACQDCGYGGIWSFGGMILTGETEVLGEKHYTALVVDV
jgi:hypothetical protein